MVSIDVKKRDVYVALLVFSLIAGIVIVNGYGTNQPQVFGHSAGEVEGLYPAGAVMMFNLDACPDGWSELLEARGRVILGLPQGGEVARTNGDSLSDGENRVITEVPVHKHSVDPPNTDTNSKGGHTHGFVDSYFAEHWGADKSLGMIVGSKGGQDSDNYLYNLDKATASAGAHTHSVNVAAFDSASTGVASVDVTMPYIQLLVCEKN